MRTARHLLRRGHLYTGLFLFPWAVLYGVTAFLFNHPTAFPDQPTSHFGPAEVAGTPLEHPPPPAATAAAVVAELVRRGHAAELLTPETVRFGRDFAFATAQADGQTVSVLVDPATGGGTVRVRPDDPPKPTVTAAFAVAGTAGGKPLPPADPIRLPDQLPDRMTAALPEVLTRLGLPAGRVTVTSTPDVLFAVRADGRNWQATYSPTAGTLTAVPLESVTPPPRSTRQRLLRLHTAHGFPGTVDARWLWAVAVDVMAAVLVFWAGSGLVMWWQVKATRWAGAGLVALGLLTAAGLSAAMVAR